MNERTLALEKLAKMHLPEIEDLRHQELLIAEELDTLRKRIYEATLVYDMNVAILEKYYDALETIDNTPPEVKELGSKDVQP